jgi:hypothetical protein
MAKEQIIKNKERILIIGVSFFVLLFAVLWIISIKTTIFNNTNNSQNEEEKEYWQTLQAEVFTGFEEMNTMWEEAQSNKLVDEGETFLEAIKEKVKEEALENNNQLSHEEEKKEEELNVLNNCPEFINCMPTYSGEENFCVVPPGCEDITLKVY